ncbi:MAG: glycosyltransferase family 4 protein [Planctomycetota bacterium]|jgi:glycosyltransferase involved in cell wall biosynthesis
MAVIKPLRVCIVSPLYHTSLGGVGRQALALTEKLEALGLRAFVITRKMKGLPKCVFSARVPIFRVRTPSSHVVNLVETSVLNLAISLSFSLGTALILLRKRTEYDLVHFHGAGLPLITNIPVLKFCGKKIISRVVGAKNNREAGSLYGKYSVLGSALIRILRKVDFFIAISEEIKRDLLNEGYEHNKIARIRGLVDKSIFYPCDEISKYRIKTKLGLASASIVAFSGRLVETKGVGILLQAWRKIVEDCKDILLLILGGGELEEELKQQSRAFGIENSVKFCGIVDNVRDHLVASDLFAFPSLREGLPNSVLEAMACGLPVVSTRIGGVVDLIRDGENGLLVEPGNVDQLADALKRLICDTEYASALGNNALKTARENHDIDVVAGKYIELYAELMKNGKAGSK